MSDFWDSMNGAFAKESAIDTHLQGQPFEGDYFTGVRELAEKSHKGLKVPVVAGTRVSFVADLDSVLTYPDVPGDNVKGTVITVRSAAGDVTYDRGRVFVMWDDGDFRPIMAEHLLKAKSSNRMARSVRIVTSDLSNLAMYFAPAMGVIGIEAGDDLVHRATKDLWSFQENEGSFVLERLFDETGDPLKV